MCPCMPLGKDVGGCDGSVCLRDGAVLIKSVPVCVRTRTAPGVTPPGSQIWGSVCEWPQGPNPSSVCHWEGAHGDTNNGRHLGIAQHEPGMVTSIYLLNLYYNPIRIYS